jgi:ligand-binding sensor protein
MFGADYPLVVPTYPSISDIAFLEFESTIAKIHTKTATSQSQGAEGVGAFGSRTGQPLIYKPPPSLIFFNQSIILLSFGFIFLIIGSYQLAFVD